MQKERSEKPWMEGEAHRIRGHKDAVALARGWKERLKSVGVESPDVHPRGGRRGAVPPGLFSKHEAPFCNNFKPFEVRLILFKVWGGVQESLFEGIRGAWEASGRPSPKCGTSSPPPWQKSESPVRRGCFQWLRARLRHNRPPSPRRVSRVTRGAGPWGLHLHHAQVTGRRSAS